MLRWCRAPLVLIVLVAVVLGAADAAASGAGSSSRPKQSASAAGAVIPAAEGRPLQISEPTYRWHGLTVPVGACGAIVGGREMVLPCGDKRVVAYRRQRAAERAADWRWAGAGAAAAVSSGVGFALWRRRVRRGV